MKRIGFAVVAALLFGVRLVSYAQTVTVKDTVYVTYPYSDPDPVPAFGKIYPYFRYDGYSLKAEKKVWKVVVLENDCLRVRIMPQIGGKIWSVYDKRNGKELFYDNDVVKFRDISLRGPWTSGGIEFNFGVIGHAPSCFTDVDFTTARKADGSVSCCIGTIDLLTRTRWTVEISLPAEGDKLRTSAFWHNGSGTFQPYYNWFNSGVKASEDLELIYPSSYSIAHSGQIEAYPYDPKSGNDLSKFAQLKFGDANSFHPGGSRCDFFAVYWKAEDYGLMHQALRDEKVGRKFFNWSRADAGDIWVELLTDTRGQYVELQSGRLFNQNMESSNDTPFKQFLFTPFGTDQWNEYWFPFTGELEFDEQKTTRPSRLPEDFNPKTASSYQEQARCLFGMRAYGDAMKNLDKALELDPCMGSALSLKAAICLEYGEYAKACELAGKALAVNTYDPEANYIGGIAAMRLGRESEALDHFEIAAITPVLRSAATTQLSRMHFKRGDFALAADYAGKSLINNSMNISGLEMLYLAKTAAGKDANDVLDRIAELDPLCHFPGIERFLAGKTSADALAERISHELAWEEYLEYAIFYHGLGLEDKACRLLAASPEKNALTQLWTAFMEKDASLVPAAETAGLDHVFPFRDESFGPLRWAVEHGGRWQSRYLLAMLYSCKEKKDKSLELIKDVECDHAPFYAYRAFLTGFRGDLEKAASLEPQQWRYCNNLALHFLGKGDAQEALSVIEPYCKKHPENFHVADTYVRTLIALKEYSLADKVIGKIRILPFEGQTGGHVLYRDIKLHLAAEQLDKGRYKAAIARIEEARLWPHELGAGKPYDADTSLEDWMAAVAYSRMGDAQKASAYLSKVPDTDGSWKRAFESAAADRKSSVSGMLGKLDDSFDKRLF